MPRDTEAPRDPVADMIAEINAEFMVVIEGGRVVIYKPDWDPMLKRDHFVRMQFADFKKWFMNLEVCVGVDAKKKPIMLPRADVWLKHAERRQYSRVIFDPSGKNVRKTDLNLWRGFAVTPKPGSWALMQDHILKIICAGDQALFDWLKKWMARAVQFPGEQGEVAVVLKGIEGSGKSILLRALLYLFGQHGITISNSKHLVGNFNGHLRDCVFLSVEEAFFAGDKQHVGVLKALITENKIAVEGKGKDVVLAPNLLHIMMASNEDWVIPASLQARRFFVLVVLPDKKGNRSYFAKIQAEMEAGGYEAMLHDLLNYDLTSFDHRNAPSTEGLQEQKKLSLGTDMAWWVEVLHRGYVFRSKMGLEDYFSEWHDTVATELLFASYDEYAKSRHERRPMNREDFGKFMRNVAGGISVRPSKLITGEHMTETPTNYGSTRKAAANEQERAWGYRIGTLEAARNQFIDKTGLPGAWPEDVVAI